MTDSGIACHYVPDLVAVPRHQAGLVAEFLTGDDEWGFLGPEDLFEFLGGEVRPEIVEKMLTLISVVRLGNNDPREVAPRLRKGGIDASPIHGLGPMNHISAMPGTEPTESKASIEPDQHYPDPYGVVAVVDTGITTEIPEWLSSGMRWDDPEDIENLGGGVVASHGTFVSGLIRLISPNHVVSMARAREVDASRLLPQLSEEHVQDVGGNLTTELHVLEAIVRLVDRHAGDPVDALNLSLGGYTCEKDDPAMVALGVAIAYWLQRFPRAPIFAAGGNTPAKRPVYPGAFQHVRAVAAAIDGGDHVVWDPHSTTKPKPPTVVPRRPWITDVAPGSNLLGPSGVSKDHVVKWSGSSFATAVATACYVSRRPMEVDIDLICWPAIKVPYGGIPGLHWA